MSTGTIAAIKAGKGYGFIARPDGPDVFFHCLDLDDAIDFDERLLERRVIFDIVTDRVTGKPRAANVRPAP